MNGERKRGGIERAFGIRWSTKRVQTSLFGLLPVLLFRLFGVERHYTISLLHSFFLPLSTALLFLSFKGQRSGFVPGVGGKSGPVLPPPLFLPPRNIFEFQARSTFLPVPVNYTLTNFPFIRGLLIHELFYNITGRRSSLWPDCLSRAVSFVFEYFPTRKPVEGVFARIGIAPSARRKPIDRRDSGIKSTCFLLRREIKRERSFLSRGERRKGVEEDWPESNAKKLKLIALSAQETDIQTRNSWKTRSNLEVSQ